MKKLNILRSTLLIGIMATTVLTHATTTTWTGADSTDWNTAANWSAGIPSSTVDAVIVSSPHNPIVGSSGAPSVNNLTITSGSITIPTPLEELDIYGNMTVSTVNAFSGDGALGLIGTGTISGNGFTVKSIYVIGSYSIDAGMNGSVDVRGAVVCSNTLTSN